MTSILYRSNQEVKSSASGCGVTLLDDYHIRLVYYSQAWPDGYDLEPIRVNGLWVPGLGQLILNAPYLVIDTTVFSAHAHTKFYCLDTVTKPSHTLLSLMYGSRKRIFLFILQNPIPVHMKKLIWV